jgi:hypothetical protein
MLCVVSRAFGGRIAVRNVIQEPHGIDLYDPA